MPINLDKLQKNYYNTAIANSDIANQAMTHLQNGILALIFAELAFLGVTDLSKTNPSILSIFAAVLLIISAFLFISGAYSQWSHVIKSAREYYKLSKTVAEFIQETSIAEVAKLPEFLTSKELMLKTSNSANWFFNLTIIGIMVASVLIFAHLIFKI